MCVCDSAYGNDPTNACCWSCKKGNFCKTIKHPHPMHKGVHFKHNKAKAEMAKRNNIRSTNLGRLTFSRVAAISQSEMQSKNRAQAARRQPVQQQQQDRGFFANKQAGKQATTARMRANRPMVQPLLLGPKPISTASWSRPPPEYESHFKVDVRGHKNKVIVMAGRGVTVQEAGSPSAMAKSSFLNLPMQHVKHEKKWQPKAQHGCPFIMDDGYKCNEKIVWAGKCSQHTGKRQTDFSQMQDTTDSD